MTGGLRRLAASVVATGTLLLAGAGALADDAGVAIMNAEIDHLLEAVAGSGCTFIRNGKEHAPDAARDHLAMKRKRGRRYFDSADEFVERIASRSSLSRKDYMIRCEGNLQTAKAWFSAVLADYRLRETGQKESGQQPVTEAEATH